MKRKFTVNALTGEGLDEFINSLDNYDKWLKAKANELLTRLTDEGYQIAAAGFTGAAYDGTNESASFEQLKGFLLDAYQKKRSGEPIPYERDEHFVSRFDYSVIAEKFIEIAQGKE